MKRLLSILTVLGAVGFLVHGADPVFVSPDVPTTTSSGAGLLPHQIFRYTAAGPLWTLEFSVPGFPPPNVDALHRMDEPGDWLFSIEVPNDLAGALAFDAAPSDVIRYDSSAGSYSICFSGAAFGLGPETNVDAVYMTGGDEGELFLSFDVPTDIGAFSGPTAVEPADIVRFSPIGVGVCPSWSLAGLAFDASAVGGGVPLTSNVGGADDATGLTILTLDVPSDLAPPGITFFPGLIAQTDGLTYTTFEPLLGWPLTSEVDGVSCLANPGQVPATLTIGKSTTTAGDLTLTWDPSCSSGGEDYGVYEGTIGTWNSHTAIDCIDGGTALTEDVTPALTSNYYLVVPHSQGKEEGSYGLDFIGGVNTERPVGVTRCAPNQVITDCP
jgi:hypothetical protein